MPGEFELIARHFAALTQRRADVVLGVGDDAALLDPPPGQELVVTVDTLALGVHFFADCPPAALGHKALAVNLSDLAAMGAEPAWALLALTLLLSSMTLATGRATVLHGAVHLVVFAVFLFLAMVP